MTAALERYGELAAFGTLASGTLLFDMVSVFCGVEDTDNAAMYNNTSLSLQ